MPSVAERAVVRPVTVFAFARFRMFQRVKSRLTLAASMARTRVGRHLAPALARLLEAAQLLKRFGGAGEGVLRVPHSPRVGLWRRMFSTVRT